MIGLTPSPRNGSVITMRLAVTAYSGYVAADELARQWSLLTIKWMWPSIALVRYDHSTSSARHTRIGPLHGWRGVAFRQQETVMLRRLAGVRSVATVPVMRGMPLVAIMTLAGCTAAPLADDALQSQPGSHTAKPLLPMCGRL